MRLLHLRSCESSISFLVLLALSASETAQSEINGGGVGTCSAGDTSAECMALSTTSDNFGPPKTISVVLPCANEGQFALQTVEAVYASTPSHVLHEIVVVDDGSTPKLKNLITKKVRERYAVKLIRHEQTQGLITSKKHGGDAAQGDIVVFFDCHVAPQENWYKSFLRLIGANYRRIVVPVITDLDIDTWTQSKATNSNNKCYMSWDADFKWFESTDDFVPVLSGGLLGISKRWWNETGGYDEHMFGWGGENIDQSLRSWLCGGEIMSANDSFVAHMWRKTEDLRTARQYNTDPMNPVRNRLRAAVAWYGAFKEKIAHFPRFSIDMKGNDGKPWYGNIANIEAISSKLKCKPLVWYFKRFKNIYTDGGLIPNRTFSLRTAAGDHCLTFLGPAGTNPYGRADAILMPCNYGNDQQRWHGANRNLEKAGHPCCSGLRAWNTDQCVEGVKDGKVQLYACNIAGQHPHQQWKFQKGMLRRRVDRIGVDECIQVDAETNALVVKACDGQKSWRKQDVTEPLEARLYREQLSLLS